MLPIPTRKFFIAVLILCLGGAAPVSAQSEAEERPRNVILFVADGGGPASFTMARDYLRWKEDRQALAFDSVLVGSIRTFATSSRVTDSAAGATAFSTGVKTYNGAIAVDPEERPLATLLEAAEQRDMATGLVATSRLTHATPASFAAHVPQRAMENQIAAQMMEQDIEVLLGGGRRHFLPDTVETSESSEGERGQRTDDRDLLEEARANGYNLVQDRRALMDAQDTPVLGLFTRSHMAYEVDRDAEREPSLAEMSRKALDLLSTDEEGFFLMIEGSRIDHAAHGNDAAGHLYDLLAYEEAIREVLEFAREEGNTLVLATSDHETGGLTLGRNRDGGGVYDWQPEVLDRIEASHGEIIAEMGDNPDEALIAFRSLTGIDDLSSVEEALIHAAFRTDDEGETEADTGQLSRALAEIISRRALVGWTSTGHTAVDVNVYAYGPGHDLFIGNFDNTYIGETLAEIMDFDLEALTEELRSEEGLIEASTSER